MTPTATARTLAALPDEARRAVLVGLSSDELAALEYSWPFWARPDQLPPDGDWRTWAMISGRGAGTDQELIDALTAPTVIALFADDGEREMIIHQGTDAPGAKLVVFRDRQQARLFVAGAHAFHNAGSRAALVLCEVRANLQSGVEHGNS
jgi:hypothetical protein